MLLPRLAGGSSRRCTSTDDTRARLQTACTDLGNALFDRAALASDAQHHARTLRWLRVLREHGETIIDALQTELAQSDSTRHALDADRLVRLVNRHFAMLDPNPDEAALLEAVFSRQFLQAPSAPTELRPTDHDATTARIIARLRMSERRTTPGDAGATEPTASPAMAEVATTAIQPRKQQRSAWHTALLSVSALALLITAGPPTPLLAPNLPNLPSLAATDDAALQVTAAAVTLPAVTSDPATTHDGEFTSQPATTANEVAAIAAVSSPEPDTPAAASPPPLDDTPTLAAATPAPMANNPASTSDPRLALQVEFLLRRADAALAVLHLSEPFPDSAAANYTAVLALDPDNTLALEGLERVVSAYGRLVDGALADGNLMYADTLLLRARAVQPSSALLVKMDQETAMAHDSGR